ncbi:6.4 kDa triple gene block protein [Indian citrus ringspot virus]|uniref:Movement protein TGBp3 n=1 Tax=Indian citrus ringspot virus (isolate Kinnow mandarin/India/K1/1996) TaxID=651357 RepID=TGB3_ICRSV|nr:6.4 kDa triple gene block protein [Indian citrus ringspot virus]Q918W0.1 RecName: Full=Movement protein TGBp3; AltName: Full=Triple gene block 3 protein; Short=TGBp3 [Indian citrus ringspot virus K1]AAK97525.1 6.4 kDa triple gene block protein [Indian citrus ringspot virus]
MHYIDWVILLTFAAALIVCLTPKPEPCIITVSGASATVSNCPNPELLTDLVKALKPAKPV